MNRIIAVTLATPVLAFAANTEIDRYCRPPVVTPPPQMTSPAELQLRTTSTNELARILAPAGGIKDPIPQVPQPKTEFKNARCV